MTRTGAVAVAWFLAMAGPVTVVAQAGAGDDALVLQEASRYEAAGQMAMAEDLLRSILETQQASAPALLALERVLRHQGRLADLPSLVETAVALEPGSALLNQLLLRTYSSLDREPDLAAAAAAWMEAAPGVEIPYREAARIWEARGDYRRARLMLEEGRDRIGARDALALELGSLYATLNQPGLAAREWDRALGPEAGGLSQIRRHLRSLPDGGSSVLAELVARLGQGDATGPRLAAGVDLAVDAGLEGDAMALGRRLTRELEGAERSARLLDVARRAEGARMRELARWAYGELMADERADGLPAIRERFASLTLALGDSAGAAAAYGTLEADGRASTAQQRQAAALRIELLAAHDPIAAMESLREFRSRYQDAVETDRLTAAVAEALIALDRHEAAEALMIGVRGPRSALLRGRLALARGDREDARSAFLAAAPGLSGAEATRALSLATLLGRVSDRAARWIGRALDEVATGDPGGALDRLIAAAAGLEPGERAALLEFAAGVADAEGLDGDAVRLRRMIIADHPRSGEAPAALLALARRARAAEGDVGEARELLERLIIEYPRNALVPQARRELDQIQRRGGGSARGYRGTR